MRAGPSRGLESVDEIFLSTRAQEDLTRYEGSTVLHTAHRSPRTKERVQVLETWAGRESKAWKEKASEGKTQESHDQERRGNPKFQERSRRGNKASKQVKLAERSDSAEPKPGTTGKRASARGKGVHSRPGNQATA